MNNRKIEDIINKAITKFNLISPKNMQIKNFKNTQYTKKLDSLNIINLLYKKISEKPPVYLNQILLIAFSIGIFRHLEKSSLKIKYFREKYITFDFTSIFKK
jgi:hypothetical protein